MCKLSTSGKDVAASCVKNYSGPEIEPCGTHSYLYTVYFNARKKRNQFISRAAIMVLTPLQMNITIYTEIWTRHFGLVACHK